MFSLGLWILLSELRGKQQALPPLERQSFKNEQPSNLSKMKQLFDIHAESPEMHTQNVLYSQLSFPPSQNYVDFNLQNTARQEMHFSSVAITY